MEAAAHPWPTLGVLLVRDGLVEKGELEALLEEQRDSRHQRISGWRLGELLIERGLTTYAEVARLVAEQYELPYMELRETDVDPETAALLSDELVERFSALPLTHLPDGSLLLAVADPGTVLFSDELRRALGVPLRFAVVAPDAMEAALASMRGGAQEASGQARAERVLPFPAPRTARSWPPLGALLVRDGLVTDGELEAALAQQRVAANRRLGEILVERGVITRADVARRVAEQYELPFVEVDETEVDPDVASLFPLDVAQRYSALPLRFLPDGSLLVAVEDPTCVLESDEILDMVGARLSFAVAAPDAIDEALARLRRAVLPAPGIANAETSSIEHPAPVAVEPDSEEDVTAHPVEDDEELARAETGAEVEHRVTDEIVDGVLEAQTMARREDEPAVPVAPVEPPGEAGVVDELDHMIDEAIALGASAIHFSPHEQGLVVRARFDGVMRDIGTVPSSKRVEATIALKKWEPLHDRPLEVAVLPTRHGERVTLRVRGELRAATLTDLGMASDIEQVVRNALRQPSGLVLACGPTESGKTTTLYAALRELITRDRMLLTIEDPVEWLTPGVDQIEVDPGAGLTFAHGLETILRSDPDVALVGELRDRETAHLAVSAAATRALVLSSLASPSVRAAIQRLTDLGVEPGLLGSSMICLVAQRLVRRICASCRETYYATAEELAALGRPDEKTGRRLLARGRGCPACGGTGHRGRVALFEVLTMTDDIRDLIGHGASTTDIHRAAIAGGMRPLREDGIRLALEGITTPSEVRRVVGD